MPDNLRSQMPIISDMIKKMGIPIIEISGVEADDVI
jgi:5'-3' exonuclease